MERNKKLIIGLFVIAIISICIVILWDYLLISYEGKQVDNLWRFLNKYNLVMLAIITFLVPIFSVKLYTKLTSMEKRLANSYALIFAGLITLFTNFVDGAILPNGDMNLIKNYLLGVFQVIILIVGFVFLFLSRKNAISN